MKLVLAAALCLTAVTAQAQTVKVRSGSHPGYTRIAFDLPARQGWQFGRDGDGYVLRMDRMPDLDLSRVWRMIGRDRIAGLTAGAAGLQLTTGCSDCHAVAFETRPGTIVIDVKTGPAPAGSRFEAQMAGLNPRPQARPADMAKTAAPAASPVPADTAIAHLVSETPTATEVSQPTAKPAAAGYDWTSLPREPAPLPLPRTLDPFRDAVLRQLAEGATRGVVDMVETLPPTLDTGPLPPQMRVEEEPGFIEDPDSPLTADGRSCIPDDRLTLAAWGGDAPVAQGMANARAALEGEFDIPDPVAVDRAIRYYLHLGFGAEARQMATVYKSLPDDRRLYDELGRILDGEPVTDNLLQPMAGCDGIAALWGILALPEPLRGQPENTGAALQAFVALPKHLRHALAGQLVARFEARHDDTSARIVTDSVLRATPDPDPATRLLVARQAQDGGVALEDIVAGGGHGADGAIVALAERRLNAAEAVDAQTLVALQAFLKERAGGEDEARLRRLVVLALGSTTQFDAAFAALPGAPDAAADLWGWLARTGGDDSLLRHAVLATDAPTPRIPAATRLQLANRLTDLGLPEPALHWLNRADMSTAPDPERLAAARAHMARRDAREALRLIAGMEGEVPDALRIRAEAQLADPAPPSGTAWAEAQSLLSPATDATGALSQGKALVSGATEARSRIEALLNAAAMPE